MGGTVRLSHSPAHSLPPHVEGSSLRAWRGASFADCRAVCLRTLCGALHRLVGIISRDRGSARLRSGRRIGLGAGMWICLFAKSNPVAGKGNP